ncbi:Methyltransferase type 11 [Akanthomyces lecanii RCEF 1005]|uniref:Methyltransferase type 11 n=1 Tax=Akanthomyces lecanii RCEF 1005 TaxID=1081108 RepID=A0A168H3J2_CORDF|nr:Methyltransferase type 11 [Akanthomyces lecanii RCEF 1005]
MASLKREFGGYGLPANPSDGVRSRRMQTSASGGLPRPINSNATREVSSTKPEQQPRQQHSRIPSRSTRMAGKPDSGLPVPTSPPQSHEPRRMPSISVSGSSSSRSRAQGSLDSSSSGISYDSSLKSLGEQPIKRASFIPRNTAVPDENRRISASPKRQSMASIDEALDIYLDIGTKAAKPDSSALNRSPELRSNAPKLPFIYPELDRYRNHEQQSELGFRKPSTEGLYKLSTHDLPPPTPASAGFSGSSSQLSMVSASPSTKFSASPGPGPYSRDTTPTSISSQSPGLIAPSRPNYYIKPKQSSPAYSRPPVTRRRAGSIPQEADTLATDPRGLDAVRESVTSSSSSSTVREGGKTTPQKRPGKLVVAPPNPPPRKSSQKFRKAKDDSATEEEKMPAVSSKGKSVISSPQRPPIPLRPSRKGTPDLKSQLFDPVPVIQSNLRGGRGDSRGSESTSHSRKSSSPTKPTKNASISHLPVDPFRAPVKENTTTSRPQTAKSSSSAKSSSISRFNFFGRKKTSDDQEEKKETRKLARKGPAAGTGHEGYGKIGAPRRRSGGASHTYNYAGPQASQETIASDDSFFADRMNPVVISGGGLVENRNRSFELSPTDSSTSQSFSRPSTESQLRHVHGVLQDQNKLQPSLLPYREHRFYSSSDSEDGIKRPTLALRRSVQRLNTAPDSPLRLPQPINTSAVSGSPLTSIDTSVLSDDSHIELHRDLSQDSTISQQAPRKLKKKQRSPRKWNFFGRAKTTPEPAKASSATVAATVTTVEVDKRPVAFYAIMDASEHGNAEDPKVHDVLYDANVLPHRLPASSFEIQRPSPVLDSTMTASASAPAVNEQGVLRPIRRPSRLQQVGRIPKVATRYHNPASPRSYSRPFRASLQKAPISMGPNSQESAANVPMPLFSTEVFPQESTPGDTTTQTASQDSHRNSGLIGDTSNKEFLSFSPRKFSIGTACTSSSSSVFCYAGATAIIPQPDDPPAEDEIWEEYNDLLVDDSERLRRSTTSSRGTPFHLETYQERLGRGIQLESPVVAERKVSMLSDLSRSSYCSADMTERLKAAFQPHASSLRAGDEGLWMRRRSAEPTGSRRHSSGSAKTRFSGSSSSSFDYNSPLAQVNLRVGSMTVSKWLTFGHVLFSDLRHELIADRLDSTSPVSRHSILVLDGLGNDDWSFYVAETYPKANFYNLSPRAPLAENTKKGESSALLSPPNHHQVQYIDHLAKFPFAPQSFDSVVYRFPVAAPESHYRNIIAEARRVLKPGGFLELAILDLDLNNMGNRGRRAIRTLKEMIHEQSPGTSLASAADILVKLLGKGGFSGIRAAKVGVPVASSITQPRNSSGSSKKPPPQAQASLSDMMKENGPAADANITKMVTRVGRWWYTRCYENAAGAKEGRKGIWDDKALLNECQELGTSLKLTVCCARAPADRVTSL